MRVEHIDWCEVLRDDITTKHAALLKKAAIHSCLTEHFIRAMVTQRALRYVVVDPSCIV